MDKGPWHLQKSLVLEDTRQEVPSYLECAGKALKDERELIYKNT